jgi:ribulose 1,5-bisphosphate synthetase/thiazole synthase
MGKVVRNAHLSRCFEFELLNMHVIIVGCGIAGLSLAIGLRKFGHDVVILERATDVPAVCFQRFR